MGPVDPLDPYSPPPSPWRLAWRWTKAAAIAAFVLWHLFFLAWRNPNDLWEDGLRDWFTKQPRWGDVVHDFNKPRMPTTDGDSRLARRLTYANPSWERWYEPTEKWTKNYGRVFGIEQGWSMFTPNLARGGSFLTARIEFSNGSEEYFKSPNEPALESDDFPLPKPFLRAGGWRQRKLEDCMLYTKPEQLARMDVADGDDLPLFEAYAAWALRRWQASHPADRREPFRVVLLRRRLPFPSLEWVWVNRATGEVRGVEAPPPAEERDYSRELRSLTDVLKKDKVDVYTIGHFERDKKEPTRWRLAR
jgi:hypothetical protein